MELSNSRPRYERDANSPALMRIAGAVHVQCDVRRRKSRFRMGDMAASSCIISALFVFEHCWPNSDGLSISIGYTRDQMFDVFKSFAGIRLWRFNC